MLEVEKIEKPPKGQAPSGSVGQKSRVCADSPVTTPKIPAATLACPGPEHNTRATSIPHELDWTAREGLPETEVKLDFIDIEEKAGSGHRRKIRHSASQKNHERDLSLQNSGPCPWPSGTSVLSLDLDQIFLERQVEGALGLLACSKKRKTCSLGRPGLHPVTCHAKCRASLGQSKPKGDSAVHGLKPVLGQEPPLQPEKKKASRQKSRGQREGGEQTGRKSRSPLLSSGRAPSIPALVQTFPQSPHVTSPDRLEGSQSSESKEARQVDVFTACVARKVRLLKKRKKQHLPLGVREKSRPQPSLQKPPCLKKLVRAIKAETKGLDSVPHSVDPLHATGLKPTPDVRQFFTLDSKNNCHVICSLCHTSIRQGKIEGRSQTSGLVRHLASKHGLKWERRPATASREEGTQQKGLPPVTTSPAPQGLLAPTCSPDAAPLEGSDRELALGKPEQLFLDSPPLPASPTAVRDNHCGIYAPNQPQAQAWNHSIAELLCSLALPLSFISSQPFRKFMAQVDACYHLPSLAFFSDKALPLLHEAVGEQVLQEMQWAEGGRVHLTTSMSAQDLFVNYVVVTAHWVATQPDSRPLPSGSPRKQAVLWVRGLTPERAAEDGQLELLEQISLWLGRGSLRAGFLVSGGCPSLEQAVRVEGYTHIPCFIHCLDSVVRNFLHHHHSAQIILGTARAICNHFQGSVEARRLLAQLQHQCGLPAHQPFEELSDHWVSAYHLMEWLMEQQQPLQAYEEKYQLGKTGTALSATFWSLTDSLVKLLQPFQMVVQEASTAQASLSQVLPQLRYLHIFLEQVHGCFEEQSVGEVGAAIRLAEGLALQLSTDCQLNELFYREEFVLATLLDPRFKSKIEAILPVGADIDHWKQVLVYKVKEIMVSEYALPISGSLQSPTGPPVVTSRIARSSGAEGKSQKEPLKRSSSSGSFLLVQREKSLLERLESVGLLASERSGASLATENHQASIIIKKYLRENETVGAQEDPLAYWEKKREAWPALARLATIYLSCPPTRAFSKSIFASLHSPTIIEQNSLLQVEAVEHLLFLKTNLENFPNYTPPPLIFSGSNLAKVEQTL